MQADSSINEIPSFRTADFKCPRCGHFCQQQWYGTYDTSFGSGLNQFDPLWTSRCLRCKLRAIWLDQEMIYPEANSLAPIPSPDMPEVVLLDFDEARAVLGKSPRAACALLRLATEKLCRILVGNNKTFNKAIDALVEQGVSEEIQQALDVIRVTGNSAVHPGQIVEEDTEKQALFMFELLNVIVDQKIGLGRRLSAAIDAMPESIRKPIIERGLLQSKSATNS